MKRIKFVVIYLLFAVLSAHSQHVKIVKASTKYTNSSIGGMDNWAESTCIWTESGVFYNNPWLYSKPQQSLLFVDFSNDFTVTDKKIKIEYKGQSYGIKKIISFTLAGKEIELVHVLNQKESTSHFFQFHLLHDELVLDREILSLTNQEDIKRVKLSSDQTLLGIIKEKSYGEEKNCSFIVIDSTLNTLDNIKIGLPSNKERTITIKDFSISNTGKMAGLFYYTDKSSSFLYILPIEEEAKPIYLDFNDNATYFFNDSEINFYNDNDANVAMCYRKADGNCGYAMFDTKNEEDDKIKVNLLNFNQNATKYTYESPKLNYVFTFPQGLQVYVFLTDLKKGANRLISCLKTLTLLDGKIVSQYDIIRDMEYVGYCYPKYINNHLYIFFSGLKGKGEDYSFEEVKNAGKDIRMIKYLRVNQDGVIEEFEISGTEGNYLLQYGTRDKGNQILLQVITLGIVGKYGNRGFMQLEIAN